MTFVSVTTAFPRPYGKQDPAFQLLYQQIRERITQIAPVSVTLNLSLSPIAGTLDLFKNGTRLDDVTGFTIRDRTVTLAALPNVADVFVARYYFRATRTV